VKVSSVKFEKLLLISLGSDSRSQDRCDLHIRYSSLVHGKKPKCLLFSYNYFPITHSVTQKHPIFETG